MFYGAAILFSIGITIFALLDLIATAPERCRVLPKILWLPVVIFLPTVGPLAWVLLGRPEKANPSPRDLGYRADPGTMPKRPLGPDDDPRFLEMTGGPVRPAARKPQSNPGPPKPPASSQRGHPSGAKPPAHGV
ncbi:MAG TPA: PLD nuclease N-terminal domain-containing protein, partial [Actinomycetota bacterium]|nr:PLD nuclease N-terminal domain-containing protein [Actinomycetota bacterium]